MVGLKPSDYFRRLLSTTERRCMENRNAVNRPERTTIRADVEARDRINLMAEQMGMSQERFVGWMAELTETCLHMHTNNIQHAAGVNNAAETGDMYVDINNYDLLMEIKSVKRVVYRMIKELCRITDSDVNDPDSGITIRAKYDDQLLHPEKYRRRYTSTYGKGK